MAQSNFFKRAAEKMKRYTETHPFPMTGMLTVMAVNDSCLFNGRVMALLESDDDYQAEKAKILPLNKDIFEEKQKELYRKYAVKYLENGRLK